MKTVSATAGMLSAAVLLSTGCDSASESRQSEKEEPVRRAAFRSLGARDFLASCPGGSARSETRFQLGRFEELKQLAARKGAGQAIWLGENDWAGVSRYGDREPCAPGEDAYGEALAAYGSTLDTLAARIAEYRP
jgi:hypothetical protein